MFLLPISSPVVFLTAVFLSNIFLGSIQSHWLGHTTPKTRLANRCQDLNLCILKHSDNFSEGGSDIGVGIPAPGHDLTESG